VVICLELGANLHMAQRMPLPLTVSCFSKIQIGFSFLVPAHLGSPRKMAVKRVCVVYVLLAVDRSLCMLRCMLQLPVNRDDDVVMTIMFLCAFLVTAGSTVFLYKTNPHSS